MYHLVYHDTEQSQPANQFALAAAARAAVPSRTQTPTLSAAAAAAALHASPKQVTSPGSVVTRRMERRGSVSSVTSAPAGHPLVRKSSDASMTDRIGWFREDNAGSSGRPSSRGGRPPSRDSPAPAPAATHTTRRAEGKKTHDRTPSTQSEPARHAPKKAAPKQAATSHDEDSRRSSRDEPRKVSKPRRTQGKPRTAPPIPPVPPIPPAVRAAVAVAVPAPKKQQPKPRSKPKPKPVEPVYSSSSDDNRHDADSSSSSDSEPEELYPQPAIHLKKSLRNDASRTPTKKKSMQQTHSDTQGSMLSRGTMRTTVRDDMVPVIEASKERHKQDHHQHTTRAARSGSASHGAAAAALKPMETHHHHHAADAGPSDAVKALALQIMKEQQAQTAGKPVLLPSKRAKRRMKKVEEPDTALNYDDEFAAEQEEEDLAASEERGIYRRHSYAGSVSSVASYQSDLESIPEESGQGGKKKKKRRAGRESVIVPGQGGVPALPRSPLLEQERERLAQVQSPEPSANKTVERKRTLEKLTAESPAVVESSLPEVRHVDIAVIATPTRDTVDDLKGSPPSSATLTEEPVQPIIHMIPPTPPCTVDEKNAPPPRLFRDDSSEDSNKPNKILNGSILRLAKIRPSPPPRDTHSPRAMKRHSPPPRSVSPAKSALKHVHHEGSDRSSILSAEDGSVRDGAGRRKAVRVSFSEDPSVVEMDDDSYHYKPIHSALDKLSVQKQPSRGIGAVSFSSISRMRVERTPSPDAREQQASSDSRLGGLIGVDLLNRLKKVGGGKKEQPPPKDPLAPDVSSMSPAPSLSDEELESDREEHTEVRVEKVVEVQPVPPAVAFADPVAVPVPIVHEVETESEGGVQIPAEAEERIPETAVEEPEPVAPKEAQIAAGHTPPAVEIKPIFPPPVEAKETTETPAETIAQGRLSLGSSREDSETDEHFSDAYEHLDHVVMSATGSGAVLGVTAAPTSLPDAQPVAEAVVLPSIAEMVTDQTIEEAGVVTVPGTLAPQVVGQALPEEVISDEDEQVKTTTTTILSPKPIKPVSPGLINAEISPAHPATQSPEAQPTEPAQNGTSKPAATKKSAAKTKGGLSESKHSPKAKGLQHKPVPLPSPATAVGGKLKKQRQAAAPTSPRRLSISSNESESSFKRENVNRRRSHSGGFARMSMRDANGVVPSSASVASRDTGLAASRWAGPSPTSRFESGFRTGRTIGTGGPRRREWSPDTSDDEKAVGSKAEKKSSRFLGKATLRSSSAGRPHSSLGLPPSTGGFGKSFTPFKSRFEDSSDDEGAGPSRVVQSLRTHSATYRPLTPDSSDDEEVRRPATAGATTSHNGSDSFGKAATSRNPVYAPAGSAGIYGFTTSISAEVAPKKKWWNFGSKKKSKPAPGLVRLPVAPVGPEHHDPEHLAPTPPLPTPPRGGQMKKFRRMSGGSVNSMGSQRTWTPSLGTSTLAGSVNGNAPVGSGGSERGADRDRSLLRHRLSELQEMDEEGSGLERERPSTAVAGKAQVVEPGGGLYAAKTPKKKKFPKLRKMFGIED
ncbi:hypothetical protein Dda_4875 [Drechslerella dactyloides]|uniref:Uncharacterized protein n=1 Tax=Drechslerella dactyloides TaxID=74499 RepID=A0AAD6NL07_DREDA|nr:hypothetical protein Dda_4875 [Drechslerella dactyloides]